MKLSALATQYVAYKQSMGMRFPTEARCDRFVELWEKSL
jgi:hypothetical protein